jgi:RNAse (barnase) inhibitor barstar
MKSSVSTKWFNDVRPALNLVFAASAAAATVGAANAAPTAGGHGDDDHDDDNCLYCLVVKYEADRLGLNDDEGDGLKQMVHLKWIFMLDRLAEGSGPLPFPVACCTLWKDPQWLPKQWPQRQLQDLMPPWKISLAEFSLDDMLSDEVALKNHMSAVNSYLVSFINDIQGRYNLWDILPILMGWILCPVTMGWAEFPESKELKICQLWRVLDHVQKLLEQQQPPQPPPVQSEILQLLQILKCVTHLFDIIYADWDWTREDDLLEDIVQG